MTFEQAKSEIEHLRQPLTKQGCLKAANMIQVTGYENPAKQPGFPAEMARRSAQVRSFCDRLPDSETST